MAYYHKCDLCGANLDPGEKCTCIEDAKREVRDKQVKKAVAVTMQLFGNSKRKRTRKRR